MLVRIQAAQQAQAGSPDVASRSQQSQELRDQIRQATRAAQEAARDARDAQRQVRVQSGLPAVPPVPPIPQIPEIPVHAGVPVNMIPPQAVDVAIGFFIMCAVMVIGWPIARAFGRRIEQTVEAMAIEVERVSEAQRYFAKLHRAPPSEPATLESGERR